MKTKQLITKHIILGTGLLLLAGVLNIQAANAIKLDTTSLLTNSVNWSGGSGTGGTVAATDIGEFNATPQASTLTALVLGGNDTLGGLQFDNNMNGPATIGTGSTLTLGTSGINMSAANQNVTINCALTSGGSQTWNVQSGRTLTIGVTPTLGGSLITMPGAGLVSVSGSLSVSSGSGGEGILVTGGSLTTTGVSIGRNGYITIGATGVPSTISTANGFYVGSSANTVSLGTLSIATSNSGGTGRQDGGAVTASGAVVIAKDTFNSSSRSSGYQVNGGSFTSTDTSIGLQLAPNNGTYANYGVLYVSGGTATFQKIGFGAMTDTVGGAGYVTLAGGTLYVGTYGIALSNNIAGYSANVCLNSGTLGAVTNWSTSLPISLNGSVTVQAADSSSVAHNITLSGAITTISGTGALTKTGGGVLTLGGTNTYAGSTAISAGELVGVTGGSISNTASFSIAAGATNGVQLAAANGQWTTTNVIATNASCIDINLNGIAPSTSVAPLQVLGNLATTNTLTILVRGSAPAIGTYPLISYGSQSGTMPAAPVFQNHTAGYLSNDVAISKTIYLVVTNTASSVEPLLWTAATSTTWDTLTTNWNNALGMPTTYIDSADQVVFDDTASGTSPLTVNLNNTFSPVSITANLTNKNYTISGTGGVIAGTGSLTKTGTGTLTLNPSTAWTYSGGVTNAGGTILMASTTANSSACGTGPIVFNGGTLSLFEAGQNNESGPVTNTWNVPVGQTGSVLAAQRLGYTATFNSPLVGGGTFNFYPDYVRCIPTGNWTGFTGRVNIASRTSGATLMWNTALGIPNALVNLTNVTFGNYTAGLVIPLGAVMGTNATLGNGYAGTAVYVVGGLNTNSEFDGTISGSCSIRKVGTGAWTLTGNDTYTGTTLVSNGTLVVNGIVSVSPITNYSGATLAGNGTNGGYVTLFAGSTVAPGGTNNYGTLTCNGGVLFNGGTNAIDISPTTNDLLAVTGGLVISNGVVALNVSNPNSLAAGNYTLITYDSINTGGAANLTLTPGTVGTRSFTLVDTGASIQLQVIVTDNQNLTWITPAQGGLNNNWDVESSTNWTNSAMSSLYSFDNGDTVNFTDSGAANSPVNIASAVQPAAVIVSGTSNYTFTTSTAGKLSGPGSLIMGSTGMLLLDTPNNYTGPTLITNGTLQVGDGTTTGTAIGTGPITNNASLVFNQPDNYAVTTNLTGAGNLTVAGTGTLTLAGNSTYSGPTLVSSTGTVQFGNGGTTTIPTNTISLTGNGTVAFNLAGAYAVTNGITGNGWVVFNGPGTNSFGGVNTYTNTTYINNGTVKLTGPAVLPTGGGITGWLALDGKPSAAGTLDLNGNDQTVNGLSGLTGTVLGRIVNNGGSGTNTLTISNAWFSAPTYAGLIVDTNVSGSSGKVALVIAGAGTNTLTGANTYSGGTTIYGNLAVSQASSLGNGSNYLVGGTLSGTNPTSYLDLSATSLTVPAGTNGLLVLTADEKMPKLYGSGTLNVQVNATTDANHSANYGNVPTVCANFYGAMSCTGMVSGALMDVWINSGPSDGQFQNATVNLDNLTLVGTCGSGGSTAQFGVLNLHANATLGGSIYAGTFTHQIGALGGVSDIEGSVIGNGAITKVGSGTLLLNNAANTYTGNTAVNAGTLLVNGQITASPVTVNTNGILSGVGTLGGTVTANGGATLFAGTNGGIGTLTFNSNLTLNANSTNLFVVTSSGASNSVTVTGGTFTPNSSIVEINTGSSQLGAGTNTLFTYSGSTVVGSFNATPVFVTPQTGLATNALIVDDGAGHINLVVSNSASGPVVSTDPSLNNLVVIASEPPTFVPGQTNYYATNYNGVGTVTVLVTNNSAYATNVLYLNGIALATNTYTLSNTVPVGVGSTNLIQVQVTAQDGSTVSNYFVAVTELPSSDASLSNLVVLASEPPTFVAGQTNYYATNYNGVGTVTVLVTNNSAFATNVLYLNGTALATNIYTLSNTVPVGVGNTNQIMVAVTAQDGLTTSNYFVAVTELPSTNTYLLSLVLNPSAYAGLTSTFVSNTISYFATNAYGHTPTVTVVNADLTATNRLIYSGTTNILVSGVASTTPVLGLTLGLTNVAQVQVTAQDGVTMQTYTVNIVEQPSLTVPKLTNSVSGSNLLLSWPADHLGYRLLVQTNNLNKGVSGSISDWGTVPGSTNLTSTSITIQKTGVTNQYYRLVYP